MNEMKNMLKQIHAGLSGIENLDPGLKDQLLVLDQDIRRLLEKDRENNFAFAGLEDAARGLAVRFSNEHPNVSLLIGQLAEILGKMGI